MKRIDAWIGRTLFHPPIILLCQRTGMTQYAVYRYIWWLAALSALARGSNTAWWWQAFIVMLAICTTISAGLTPDRPRDGSASMRGLFLATLTLNLLGVGMDIDGSALATAQTIALLSAEYALTIRTFPPRSTREKKRPAMGFTCESTRTRCRVEPHSLTPDGEQARRS